MSALHPPLARGTTARFPLPSREGKTKEWVDQVKFIDEAIIEVIAGDGGDGSVAFRREKYVPRGGPSGGDGGKGGDVVFIADGGLSTLMDIKFRRRFVAGRGGQGMGKQMNGADGDDRELKLPVGTLVYDLETGELLHDLAITGERYIVAAGGRGGRGNMHFATSTHQAPRHAESGGKGAHKKLKLELKLLADVGLVGLPNAGKSTLISKISNSRPKIADYPFTTLEPNLGVAELDADTVLVLADIPGLIEGAHRGLGLGHSFLRHIQRTRVLIHLLDGMAEDPLLDFAQINSELALFDPNLKRKPQIVAFNKVDLPDVQERWAAVQAELQKRGYEAMAISAVAGYQVRPLLYRAAQLLDEAPPEEPVEDMPVYRLEADPRQYHIERRQDGWHVTGEAIERAAAMTYWEHSQSVSRFQRILQTLGIEDALRKAGVQNGDSVFIGDYDLEWSD